MISRRQAYTKWLGIKEHLLPPNCYRLLGVDEFETDADIISNAADARMAYLRQFQAGENAAVVAGLLNELAQARITLLHAEKKAAYDANLRGSQAPPVRRAKAGSPPARRAREAEAAVPVLEYDEPAAPVLCEAAPYVKTPARSRRRSGLPVIAVVVSLLSLAGIGAAGAFALYYGFVRDKAGESVAADDKTADVPGPVLMPTTAQTPEQIPPEPTPTVALTPAAGTESETPPAAAPMRQSRRSPVVKRPQPAPRQPTLPVVTPPPAPPPPSLPPPSPPPSKLTPPDDATQQPVAKLVADVYRSRHNAAKTPEAKRQLAQDMLRDAGGTKDAVERYVMLRIARDIAGQAGEAALAFQLIDRMDKDWEIDADEDKATILETAAAAAQTTPQHEAIVVLAGDLQGDALDLDDYGRAAHLGEMALQASRAARNGGLTKLLLARNEQLAAIIEHFEAAGPALATLKTAPDDPAASAVAGRYYALAKGDWDEGLELLSKGADEGLKQLALKELASPRDPQALGEAWWAAAEKETDPLYKRNCVDRARTWYTSALANASGLQKALLERRLGDAAKTLTETALPLLSPAADRALNAHLTKPTGGGRTVAKKERTAKKPPSETDEEARRRLASKLNVQKRQQIMSTMAQRQAERNAAQQAFRSKYGVKPP